MRLRDLSSQSSPPSRGRGSKRDGERGRAGALCRPLHGGVDRNTFVTAPAPRYMKSPPSRGRGSKHARVTIGCRNVGRPLHGGVDRNWFYRWEKQMGRGRPLHGGVDRNCVIAGEGEWLCRRPLHGGVDRNGELHHHAAAPNCRPLHGGTDRTFKKGCATAAINCASKTVPEPRLMANAFETRSGFQSSARQRGKGERLDNDPSGARFGCFLPDLTGLARRLPAPTSRRCI